VEYFPLLVFPFVKLIEHSDVIILETIITVISHWCKNWFEFHPSEPSHLLQIIEETVRVEDYSLYIHLRNHNFLASEYAWPNIRQLFSEILGEEEWCKLMDIVFTYPDKINLIYYFMAALMIEHRDVIATFTSAEELNTYDYSAIEIDVLDIMSKAMAYHDAYNLKLIQELRLKQVEESLQTSRFGPSSFPIPLGYYPKFIQFPKENISGWPFSSKEDQKLDLTYTKTPNFSLENQQKISVFHRKDLIATEHHELSQLFHQKETYLDEMMKVVHQKRKDRLMEIQEMERRIKTDMNDDNQIREEHVRLLGQAMGG
jgi:hypothetical protein